MAEANINNPKLKLLNKVNVSKITKIKNKSGNKEELEVSKQYSHKIDKKNNLLFNCSNEYEFEDLKINKNRSNIDSKTTSNINNKQIENLMKNSPFASNLLQEVEKNEVDELFYVDLDEVKKISNTGSFANSKRDENLANNQQSTSDNSKLLSKFNCKYKNTDLLDIDVYKSISKIDLNEKVEVIDMTNENKKKNDKVLKYCCQTNDITAYFDDTVSYNNYLKTIYAYNDEKHKSTYEKLKSKISK